MKYRQFNTAFWEDSYTLELSDKEVRFFIYLFTNPKVNMVGIYELPNRLICATLGASLGEIKKMQAKFQKDDKFSFYKNWVFIHNFSDHNHFSPAQPVIDSYLKDFNLIPQEILVYFLKTLNLNYIPTIVGKDNTVIIRVRVIIKGVGPRVGPRVEARLVDKDGNVEEEKLNIDEIPL